jgi:hypothetical protein
MIARLFAPLAMKVAGAIIATLIAFVVALLIQIHGFPLLGGGLIARLDRMTELRRIEADNHRKTKEVYRAAMAQAQWLEQVRLARVRAEFERNNERAQERFNDRLALLRSRYDSLRRDAGRTNAASAAGGITMPSLPATAFGADAATGEDGLSLAERYQCSVHSLQLDELISWVEAQTKVKVND